ncbi:hypothetical protein LBMAG42_04780 [Deltaproteobacteria bacterium]|nr:hypothetical protein LBMAG42_04780 [Deltaproteobacteria bacterium]
MFLVVVVGAFAADPATDWATLYDARLAEVADGTPDNAVRLYRGLLEDVDAAQPLYAMTSFWLGRALLGAEQIDEGMRVLSSMTGESARGRLRDETDADLRLAALVLLEDGQLRLDAIGRLPARWSFETGGFPAVRGAVGDGRGEVGVRREGERIAFRWNTSVRPGEPDRVTLRFGEAAVPREVGFSARAADAEAVMRVVAVDPWGQRWFSPEWTVPTDDWLDVRVGVASFVPEEGVRGPVWLDRVIDLRFEDITGERSDVRGANALILDDVYVL